MIGLDHGPGSSYAGFLWPSRRRCVTTARRRFTFSTYHETPDYVATPSPIMSGIFVRMMAEGTEPDDLDKRIERARIRMDTARADLIAGIREALADGRKPARIGRYAHWSPDQIVKIRDRKAG